MFRHCVMFRWKPEVAKEALDAIGQGLDHLKEIPQVVALRHGPDVGIRDGNWDYALIADVDSREDYEIYANEEGHLRFIAEVMAPNVEERAGVQFEMADA